MNVFQWIKNKVYKLLGIQKLMGSPNDNRLTYINDDEKIRITKIHEAKVWYIGDSSELLNFYTNQQTYGWAANLMYNRNNMNMFWSKSSVECRIKRVHSGIPRAIVDSMSNIVGKPTITSSYKSRLDAILEENDFEFRLTQQARPLVLVEGDGCWKININRKISEHPVLEWYGAEDWKPIVQSGKTIGLVFMSYYKDNKNKDYILYETRRLYGDGIVVEYNLFKLGKENELFAVDDYEKIPELKHLKDMKPIMIHGTDKLFAVPCKYYFDPLRKDRGKSLYDGKIDLFDMLDEAWSQCSQTIRVSTPVTIYPVDILARNKDGTPIMPPLYNRQFVEAPVSANRDGEQKGSGIVTEQPELNFDKYAMVIADVLSYCLIGIESPASLGIDVAKKDNADAQREKEKQTIFTRNTIIAQETKQLQSLFEQLLIMDDYLISGKIQEQDFDISIKYDEFANPSFESELQVLGPAWNNGQISTERYVNLLWAGKLSEEEMLEEIKWLDENKSQDDFDMESLMNHEKGINDNLPGASEEEEGSPVVEE